MLSQADNDLLCRVGPGTPAGELLRRYWHPVAVAEDFTQEQRTKRVKVLGEELVLYRTDENGYALVQESCPHRRVSLHYGFVEGSNIRCPYHGWLFSERGQCLEQPFEQENRRFKERVAIKAYQAREYRGIIFVYMGPDPAPVLPEWDVLARRDGTLKIYVEDDLQCNWLQPMENAVDTVHTYWLHGHMMRSKGLKGGEYYYRTIEKYSFDRNEWGILKKRVYRNATTGELDPEKGHPLIFPNVLRLPEGPTQAMHWRVPADDTRTILIRANLVPDPPGQEREHDEPPAVIRVPRALNERGDHAMDTFPSQDRMAWETQGEIYDRSLENLGAEDKGIAMYRRLLREQIELVASGQDPMALIRDPAKARVDFDVSTGQGRKEFVNQAY